MKRCDQLNAETNSKVYKQLYKRVVCANVGKCDKCPWHEKENWRHRPRPDKYKNKRSRVV